MNAKGEDAVIDFFRNPPVVSENWNYAFDKEKVRILETMWLGKKPF